MCIVTVHVSALLMEQPSASFHDAGQEVLEGLAMAGAELDSCSDSGAAVVLLPCCCAGIGEGRL